MEETREVILFREIHHGLETGRTVVFTPSVNDIDVRNIPASVYEQLKNKKPPVLKATKEIPLELVEDKIIPLPPTLEPIPASDEITYAEDDEDHETLEPIPAELTVMERATGTAEVTVGGHAETIDALKEIKYVSTAIAERLIDANFITVGDVAFAGREALLALTGITDYNVDAIIKSATELAGE